jgi:transketolase
MRNRFAKEITTLASENEKIFLISGDIGNKLFDEYKLKFPDRFLNVGVAEQNMIGVAAGLARTGYQPIVYTIATFATLRCFEQIKLDICYQNENVTIVGTGAGLSYSDLGTTHHSLEDIAILRTIPNIRVIAPADEFELASTLKFVSEKPAPTYIRIGKKGEKKVFNDLPSFSLEEWNCIANGETIAILSCGTIFYKALEVHKYLNDIGLNASLYNCSIIKPMPKTYIAGLAKKYKYLITFEEHSKQGGFGGALLEIISDLHLNVKVLRFGIADQFPTKIGDRDYVQIEYGLDKIKICDEIVNTINS